MPRRKILTVLCPHDGMTYRTLIRTDGSIRSTRTCHRGHKSVVDVRDPVAAAAHVEQMLVWRRITCN